MKNKLVLSVLILFICGLITACSFYGINLKKRTETILSTTVEELEIEETSETVQEEIEMTESEYKAACQELFYDGVFFGKDDLEGNYVKLHLFLSEKYYFTNNDMSKDSYIQYDKKYNLNKDFYKCCVLREGTNSYVGQQINMWFSDDFQLNPGDYKIGNKIIVYAQVISWSNNTMDGYNRMTIIPKYIENEQ